jgi:hypothetical protein
MRTTLQLLALCVLSVYALDVKSLSGPPSEFPQHALPATSLSAVPSRSVLNNVAFSKSDDGSWTGTSSFPITSASMPSFTLSVFLDADATALSTLEVAVTDPAGKARKADLRQSGQQLANGDYGYSYEGFIYTSPAEVGTWVVSLSVPAAAMALPHGNGNGTAGSVLSEKGALLLVTFNDDVQLMSSLDTHDFVVGSKLPVTATLLLGGAAINASRPSLRGAGGAEEQAELTLTGPDGRSTSEPMSPAALSKDHYLSAEHGAEDAFRADLDLTAAGSYTIRTTVGGPNGARSSWHAFRVVERTLELAPFPEAGAEAGAGAGAQGGATARVAARGEHCAARVAAEEEEAAQLALAAGEASHSPHRFRDAIEIDVPVSATGAGRYRVYTEVWSGDTAVCWLGTIAAVDGAGRSDLTLKMDPRWLARAGLSHRHRRALRRAPLTLRNFRVEEVENFVPVVRASSIPVPAPPTGWWPLTLGATAGADSDPTATATAVMLTGCPPAPAPAPAPALAPPSAAADDAAQASASGKILLVHGYCSDGNPFTVSDFTDAASFLDPKQSRSNDAFALLVGGRMDAAGATSIAAHSQGGLASLHLLAYYNSGLDRGGAGRKISSVGSPYQGCPLAGLLATVGGWVGAGCGSQTDLTYDGTARWLAGIPTAARQQVFYYFTYYRQGSFPYLNNYCNLAANAVLSWPNDGVVEVGRAVLPSGNRMVPAGGVEGQCHTDDMKYAAQCRDSARNAGINAAAAR